MKRRFFVKEVLLKWAGLGGLLLFAAIGNGCGRRKEPERFGNQERLWRIAAGEEKAEEPLEPAYAKKTPALYRDASMGKADPSFVPKVSGG
jgi:hypothetical protein